MHVRISIFISSLLLDVENASFFFFFFFKNSRIYSLSFLVSLNLNDSTSNSTPKDPKPGHFRGHNGRHLVWRPRGDTLNLIWTRYCVQPPTPSSPRWWSLREMHQFWALSSPLSHPLSFLITLGPPFFPAPLLSHLRLRRGYLSPPPRCVYFTSKEVSIYTILLHKYWLDFEVHTFYRALSSLASNLPPGILATTQRGSVKSCLISARGNSKSRDGRRDREIWRLIFILREGRFPPCEFSKIGKRICHQLTGGFEISREGKALESWILIED